jgi:sec-independent protein translocase protein TatA
MGGIGIGELILILAILLLVFGGGKIPELGNSIGKAIRSFRRAASTNDDIQVLPPDAEKGELKGAATAPPADARATDGDHAEPAGDPQRRAR